MSGALAAYQSKGNMYFKAAVKGTVSAKKSPLITASFGCRNVEFFHPASKQRLEQLAFTGTFTNGSRRHSRTTALTLKDVRGTLRGKPFSGECTYRNFTDPHLSAKITADVDLASALQVFPLEAITEGRGHAQLQLSFDGNLAELKRNPGSPKVKAAGEINLQQATFLFKGFDLLLSDLSGRLQVNKSHFAVQHLRGRLGRTDFELNGFFRNAVAWLLTSRNDLSLEADLVSHFVDLDQLLARQQQPASLSAAETGAAARPVSSKGPAQYELAFSPGFACNLHCDIGQLRFRRLRARQLKGRVVLRDKVLTSPALTVQALGGSFAFKGSVDARQPDLIKVMTISKLLNIQADSLLYVLENFGQNFLQDRHVRGRLSADIAADLFYDHQLNARTDLLVADVNGRITQGELLRFVPLQRLAGFLNADELQHLRFDDLHNKLQIRNRTLYIPEMEIRTSLSALPTLSISGSHTFDQLMDYRLRLPLTQLQRKQDPDEAYGPVAHRETAPAQLFLTLKGTPENFKIGYDTERLKDKWKQDLKNEKEELKNALSGKPKEEPKKEVGLNEGEYFDF